MLTLLAWAVIFRAALKDAIPPGGTAVTLALGGLGDLLLCIMLVVAVVALRAS